MELTEMALSLPKLRNGEEPQEGLTTTGSIRRPAGREAWFMAAMFCRVSIAAGTFPADTL